MYLFLVDDFSERKKGKGANCFGEQKMIETFNE